MDGWCLVGLMVDYTERTSKDGTVGFDNITEDALVPSAPQNPIGLPQVPRVSVRLAICCTLTLQDDYRADRGEVHRIPQLRTVESTYTPIEFFLKIIELSILFHQIIAEAFGSQKLRFVCIKK